VAARAPGNRRAKRSHIGAQNGPTWVQGFTTRSGASTSASDRCTCSAKA
jgi:hypothetical protein